MFRTSITRSARNITLPTRSLHSSPVAFKTVTESVKDTADDLNKKVGQGLASAIETGQKASQTVKETLGVKSKEAGEAAQQASNMAKQKTNQAAAGAREAKEDFKKEMRK